MEGDKLTDRKGIEGERDGVGEQALSLNGFSIHPDNKTMEAEVIPLSTLSNEELPGQRIDGTGNLYDPFDLVTFMSSSPSPRVRGETDGQVAAPPACCFVSARFAPSR
ncbi:hypothetical protein RRG08_026214 [Elysia crispata]|uniref:Uncharacterized protein n=1 Tax=Elysia crispata TaxID=231223 RepID=A0AAE0ZA92_9GAST|nr:hypothetical protein RRG08_026214 [Elysia crispata]